MDDLVNHEEIDRSSSNMSPFSASKEELRLSGDGEKKIPIGVFRKSRRKQQRTLNKQDLSLAVRVGRSADSVTLVKYDVAEEDSVKPDYLSPAERTPAIVLTPIFTFRDLMSPTTPVVGGYPWDRFDIPGLKI
jgi:hypothetical protein